MSPRHLILVFAVAISLFSVGCSTNPMAVATSENDQTTAALQPDLVIASFVITSVTSSRINYRAYIRNIGTRTIPDIYRVGIQNHLSIDTRYGNSDDIAAGGRILGVHQSLSPGQTYLHQGYAVRPSLTPRILFTKIDWDNIIAESNEGNNVRGRQF